jgi:hypothetical protein
MADGPKTIIDIFAKDLFEIKDIGVFLANIVTVATITAALLTLGYLIWGAIDWIISEGDKTKYENARNKITHALIGLAITASVWLIWNLVLYFTGICVRTPEGAVCNFPTL